MKLKEARNIVGKNGAVVYVGARCHVGRETGTDNGGFANLIKS